MENAQRELVRVLLDRIRSLGLISDFTCSRAMDLVHSMADFPEFFGRPVRPAEEAGGCERASDTP